VTTGTLQVTVAATGPVTNASSVPLTFKSTGKLAEVDVTVGQQVKAGDVLAKLDTTDLQTALEQAQATLAQDQAAYNKTAAGATPQNTADSAQSAPQQSASNPAKHGGEPDRLVADSSEQRDAEPACAPDSDRHRRFHAGTADAE
jgi:HlyD family secretion protein